MRFLELRLKAFGPFTDCIIDLHHGNEGLHIIYGPNEAGKSSALRAIRHMLYGIHTQTSDNFIHPYPKIRIGAKIRSQNGETLSFIRRKGRNNTLYDEADQNVIEESKLLTFLAGIDEAQFVTMFGIGHDDLVHGGQEIIQGGGAMGNLMFSAGSGVTGLRDIQAELQSEAGNLFKPSGTNPRINAALSEIRKLQQEMGRAELSGNQWVNQDRILRKSEKRKAAIESELNNLNRVHDRLERIKKALPDIAERMELLEKLKLLEDAVQLPEDFPEKRRELLTQKQYAEKEKVQAEENLTTLQEEIQSLAISPGMIDNAEQIEQVHEDLGSHRKAVKDRISLETRLLTLRGEAGEILRDLRDDITLEHAEALRLKKSDATAIRELCTRYERLDSAMENARSIIPDLEQKSETLRTDEMNMPAPRQVDELKIVIAEADEAGSMEKQIREDRADIESQSIIINNDLNRLGLTTVSMTELDSLQIPTEERISAFEQKFDELDQSFRELDIEKKKTKVEKGNNTREQNILRTEQDVPTEKDLTAAREKRMNGWQLILARLGGFDPNDEEISTYIQFFPGTETLETSYEHAVQKADEIADRLRREADRVSTRARLIEEERTLSNRLEQLASDLEKIVSNKTTVMESWSALWAPLGFTPGKPREMVRWISDFRGVMEKAVDIRSRISRTESREAEIMTHKQKLNHSLKPFVDTTSNEQETISALIKRTRNVIEEEEENYRKRERIKKDQATVEKELESAARRLKESEKEMKDWRMMWEDAVRPLGLDSKAMPAQANVILDGLRDLFEKLKEANVLEKRIQGIDNDSNEFTSRVKTLAQIVATDLVEKSVEIIAAELHQRLKHATTSITRKKALGQQTQQEERRKKEAEKSIIAVDTRLKCMCNEASCNSIEELPQIEQRAAERRKCDTNLESVEQRIRLLSAGATVIDFVSEATAEDPDTINARLEQIESEMNALTAEKSELDQTIGTARGELARMDGSAHAANIAEKIQTVLSGISMNVEQYARLRIADRILSIAIERFRKKNQGPILQQASSLFKTLTLGAFNGVRAEFDENGNPIIMGERSGEETINVSAMSDGTADQLYLALRIAGLKEYIKKNEPISFIVDDILIRFDDERAVATLKVLANLSEKTQVIFFTHHQHLVELAEKHLDAAVLNSITIQ
jgi:uncharacterized protein YhaN